MYLLYHNIVNIISCFEKFYHRNGANMDNRPIGFFDSGLGGLTCIPNLMREMPGERIVYFGDTARTPYGSKATSTIRTFSMQIADFLVQNNVKMIVIACNTVSATCLDDIRFKSPDSGDRRHKAGGGEGGQVELSRQQDRHHRYEGNHSIQGIRILNKRIERGFKHFLNSMSRFCPTY